MDNSIIQVRQLPEIVEQLHQIKDEVEQRTSQALALDCTEATLKDVKKERAELNKLFADFEARRKEVKAQILAPYEAFEDVYRECITNPFRLADTQLAGKINGVEDEIKAGKREALEAYYNEYRESLGLKPSDAPFDKAKIAVTMTATMKGLKASVQSYLDRVAEDLAMILEQVYANEIMAEYRRIGNAAQAVNIVTQRHREIEDEKKRSEEADLVQQLREKYMAGIEDAAEEYANEAAEEIPMPAEEEPAQPEPEPEDNEIYEVTFTVHGTLTKIKALKKFLIEGDYDFE